MPKLLQLNECLNLSTGKIAQQIGDIAIENGWESFIAYSGREKEIASKSKLIRVGSYAESCIHYIEDKLLDREGLSSRIATKKLLRTIDKIKPDIVHLHNIHDHWLNYKYLFQYLADNKIPVVWTQHDQWATTGHCMYNICGCERWKEECHDCPVSKWYSLDCSRRNYQLKKTLLANIPSLTIVPVSEWLGDNIRQSHLKHRPIKVIHNGIDIHTFSPQPTNAHERYGIDKGKKIILGVAAIWNERKCLNDFYELAKCLDKDKFAIIILGQLTEEIKEINGCQIVFVNRTQNALELAQLYFSASVFINPTYQDDYPTTNLEAIACGTPVITYRTGGSQETVDVEAGIVLDQGDVAELEKAVYKLASDNYKEVCRKNAINEFDSSKCFNPYVILYNKLIEGGKKIILGVSNIWNEDKGLSDMVTLSKNPANVVILVGMSDRQVREFSSCKYKECNLIPVQRTHNQYELALLYSLADVYVNPTYADMFPTVNLEALACGTPVITYRTGGSPEAIDANTGIVVEQGNIKALAEAVRTVNKRYFLSITCRRRAELYFDKNVRFEEYITLYNNLMR